MQDLTDPRPGPQGLRRAVGGKGSDADYQARLHQPDGVAQRLVAGREQQGLLAGAQLIGRDVAGRGLHEHQRAVVEDKEALKEALGAAERSRAQPQKRVPLTSLRGQSRPSIGRLGCSTAGFATSPCRPGTSLPSPHHQTAPPSAAMPNGPGFMPKG